MCSASGGSSALQILGGIGSAYGQYEQGKMDKKAAEFNALVSEQNAENAEYAAASKQEQGKTGSRKHQQKTALLVGQQKAAYGASGVDVNYGTPVEIMAETVLHGEDDAATIRYNAELEAWGLKTEAADYRKQAASYRATGQAALVRGHMGAGTTMLGSASSAALNYSRVNNSYVGRS